VNWQPTTEGLYGAACIFYKLLAGNLSEQIFNEIKDQCVLNNNQSDYFAILQIINKLASLDNENKDDNELVVRPDQLVL
jgi:hypothetical protein